MVSDTPRPSDITPAKPVEGMVLFEVYEDNGALLFVTSEPVTADQLQQTDVVVRRPWATAAKPEPFRPRLVGDLPPVADTSTGEHRRVRLRESDELPVCDTCVNILGLNIRWDHAERLHAAERES